MKAADPATGAQTSVAPGHPAEGAVAYPRLLFMWEMPPCNVNGGPILVRRLLADYPAERLHVLAGSYLLDRFIEGSLPCHHIAFPTPSNTGRWGIGRLKQLLGLAMLPALVAAACAAIRRNRIQVVVSVAHDTFFLAAAAAARLSRVPLVLIVHDDWLYFMRTNMWVPIAAARWAYRRALRTVAHIYAVCPEMQEELRREYGVESEVQYPATEPQAENAERPSQAGPLRMLFAGTNTVSITPTLNMVIQTMRSETLAGVDWQLDLYGVAEDELQQLGWADRRICAHGWAAQQEVRAGLARADVLLLPYSFEPATIHLVQTCFPSKLADYLAANRPVLICAPPESSVARYAREKGFAELVEEPSEELIAAAVRRMAKSPEWRRELAARGLRVLIENHDIARQHREFAGRVACLVQHPKNNVKQAPMQAGHAARSAVHVLVMFNTTALYGMERATIETFDLLRPEIEPTFLMTYTAHRLDLPVLREVRRRQLQHVFLSDRKGWPRIGKPRSVGKLGRITWALVKGNIDALRASRGRDVLYLPSGNYLGLALLAAVWFRLTGRRVVLHFHNLVQRTNALDRLSFRLATDAIHNTEVGKQISINANPALRRKRNAVLSIRTDAGARGGGGDEVRRQMHGRQNVFFVGQVARHKGVDLLLDAISILAADYPALALQIFGGCDDEASLRAEISSRGLDGAVHYWGYREDVGDLMRCAEIQVHPSPPSRCAESFGRTVVEAMASGVPSVCFRSGVLPEIVEHGRTGWVCETESAAALAVGMRAILSDLKLREQMGRAARRKYETCYDDATVRQNWLSYFCGELPNAS